VYRFLSFIFVIDAVSIQLHSILFLAYHISHQYQKLNYVFHRQINESITTRL